MKKDIHPENYRQVIFHDTSSGDEFLIDSTVETEETGRFEGKEYPLFKVEISSSSHPFYTGQEKVLDTAGRVERFKQRQQKAQTEVKSKREKRALKSEQKKKQASDKEESAS